MPKELLKAREVVLQKWLQGLGAQGSDRWPTRHLFPTSVQTPFISALLAQGGKQCYLWQWYLWSALFLSITVPGRIFFSSLKYRLSPLLSRGLTHRVSLQTAERATVNSAVTAVGKEIRLSTVLWDVLGYVTALISHISNLFFPDR